MTFLEIAAVMVGFSLLGVELTRRLHGGLEFLELSEAELGNISKVLATSLAVLLLVNLIAAMFIRDGLASF